MNVERLIRLAELLEADAANPTGLKFDLGFWAIESVREEALRKGEDPGPPSYQEGQTVPIDCGTVACAVGLAVLSGAFASEGFTYTIDMDGNLDPKFGLDEGWHAVNNFFEITDKASTDLFTSNAYPISRGAEGELAVAQRTRDFVNGTWQVEEPDESDDEV